MITIAFEDVGLMMQGHCVDCLVHGEADIDDADNPSVEQIRLPAEGGYVTLTRLAGGELFAALSEAILITCRRQIEDEFAEWMPQRSFADEHRLSHAQMGV